MTNATELWASNDRELWLSALDEYWKFVKPGNLVLEKEIESLDALAIAVFTADEWYSFLITKYFRWKYTAPNRYATTTNSFKKYIEKKGLNNLLTIRDEIFSTGTRNDFSGALNAARQIGGLGVAGASGLISVLFPDRFGTVDQFVVKALEKIATLPEREAVLKMNPDSLTPTNAALLNSIMERKALELNNTFDSEDWTTRKIDMVLWACRD
jgi:hypothetical protein